MSTNQFLIRPLARDLHAASEDEHREYCGQRFHGLVPVAASWLGSAKQNFRAGGAVVSVAMTLPSTRNSTRFRPESAMATAVNGTVRLTGAVVGAVIDAVDGAGCTA